MNKVIIKNLETEILGLRELVETKIKNLDDRIVEYKLENKEDHQKIIEQTTKTNGRVQGLEKWRSYMLGAISILTLMVVPLLFFFLEMWIKYD